MSDCNLCNGQCTVIGHAALAKKAELEENNAGNVAQSAEQPSNASISEGRLGDMRQVEQVSGSTPDVTHQTARAASLPAQTRPPARQAIRLLKCSSCDLIFDTFSDYNIHACQAKKSDPVEQAPRPRRMTGQQLASEFLMLPYYRQVKIVKAMLPGFKQDADVQSDADFFKDCFAAIKDANRLPELEDALEAEGVKVPAAASSPVVRTQPTPPERKSPEMEASELEELYQFGDWLMENFPDECKDTFDGKDFSTLNNESALSIAKRLIAGAPAAGAQPDDEDAIHVLALACQELGVEPPTSSEKFFGAIRELKSRAAGSAERVRSAAELAVKAMRRAHQDNPEAVLGMSLQKLESALAGTDTDVAKEEK